MSRLAKRKRVEKLPPESKKRKFTKSDEPKEPLKTVRGDGLRWKRVALPDRLDDAEGLYDLEEIDDVEVVRDDRDHVMFKPKDGTATVSTIDPEEEEWIGFDVEPVIQQDEASVLETTHRNAQSEKKQMGPAKKTVKDQESEVQETSFHLLSENPGTYEIDTSAWESLEISTSMLAAVSNLGFSKPTAIQVSAIPPILEGKDVIGKAVTGSGKTLAFGIPILERWMQTSDKTDGPIALVLAPTRELAHQLNQHLSQLAAGLDQSPRIVRVTGGLSILKQQRQLEHADIIIATPGRMWEIINESQGLIDRLKQIKFLVVDEADRLLSEGHFKEVEDILDTLDREVADEGVEVKEEKQHSRQVLVFSATFQKGLHQKLAGRVKSRDATDLLSNQESLAYLLKKLPSRTKPVFIDSNPEYQMAEHLDESIIESPAMGKDLYLYTILLQNPKPKTLVFTNSISSVKRLTPILQRLNQSALALHSSMPQKSRLRALERFTSSSQQRGILIATDVAARGLDIKSVDLIVHYHVPRSADMYVHRSGRTARAERSGRSILLCSPDEVVPTARLISKVHAMGRTPQVADLDREVIKRVRRRVELAQKIVETEQAREKLGSKDNWLKKAADELGVDYDSEEFEEEGRKSTRGRGGGKAKAMKEKAGKGKDDVAKWTAELKSLLAKRVNMGVSERYLAGGQVDVDAILDGRTGDLFLEGRQATSEP